MKRKIVNMLIVINFLNLSCVYAIPNYDKSIADEMNIDIEGLEDQINTLDSQIITAIVELESLDKKIIDNEAAIKSNTKEIEELKKEIDNLNMMLDDRVRGLYMKGDLRNPTNYLVQILNSESIGEALDNVEKVIYIAQTDKNLIEKNNENKKNLENKLKEANKLEKELEKLKKEYEENLATMEEKKKEINSILEESIDKINKESARREELARIQIANSNINDYSTSNSTTSDSSLGATIVAEAKKYLGVPYVWGGTSPSGFDCSGFVYYIYRKYGINVPRVSQDQQYYGKSVSASNLQPGDLVFWGSPANHVGIYIGDGKYIHSPRTGDVVKISYISGRPITSACRVF